MGLCLFIILKGGERMEFRHELLPLIRYDDIGTVWDELIAQVEGFDDILNVSLDLFLALL